MSDVTTMCYAVTCNTITAWFPLRTWSTTLPVVVSQIFRLCLPRDTDMTCVSSMNPKLAIISEKSTAAPYKNKKHGSMDVRAIFINRGFHCTTKQYHCKIEDLHNERGTCSHIPKSERFTPTSSMGATFLALKSYTLML